MTALPLLSEALRDRYVLEREVGRGGMAVVYLARDLKHDRPVAVKLLHAEVAAALGSQRFLREIRLTARLQHPHILPVFDSGEVQGELYFVMPYVAGGSLRARLQAERQLAIPEALQITRAIALALDYAHRHGVVHRDIKPENVLLHEGEAMVADFGIARAVDLAGGGEVLTEAGVALGTPAYMSPEQALGDPLDGRSDLYSLGCVAYEMLAGEPPFSGTSPQACLARRLTERPWRLRTIRSQVPTNVEFAIDRVLSPVAADRFATGADFAAALVSPAEIGSAPVRAAARPVEDENSIAVLPFANVSAERENEFFVDGMTDEIIDALGQVKGIRVAARSSSFAFKNKSVDAREIGERLRVRTLLQGSVRKSGERVRITAQLVNAAEGYQVWSRTFERTLADVFAVQDELARTIVETLTSEVVGSRSQLVKPPTDILEAYTPYLRGRYMSNRRTLEGYQNAVPYYLEAIGHDPKFALAYAGIAHAYNMMGLDIFGGMPGSEAMGKAKAAASKAVALDPNLGEGHLALSLTATYFEYDWETAERELERSVALYTEMSIPHLWYSLFLGAMGRHEESVKIISRACAEDPLNPGLYVGAGLAFIRARRYDEAIPPLRTVLGMVPNYPPALSELVRVYCCKGMFDVALAELERGMAAIGRNPLLVLREGTAYAMSGRRADALRILEELRELATRCYVPASYQGNLLATLGDLDEAIRQYEMAYEQRSNRFVFAATDPEWDPLRAHPWFKALLRRLRLDF